MTDVAELRELLAKATPGAWHVVRYGDGDSLVICMDEEGDRRIAFMATPGCRDAAKRKKSWNEIKSNAQLIATAINTLPSILDRLEAYERAAKGDVADILKRLCAVETTSHGPVGIPESWYRNPDGPEAADLIEALTAENEQLRDKLAQAREALYLISGEKVLSVDTGETAPLTREAKIARRSLKDTAHG